MQRALLAVVVISALGCLHEMPEATPPPAGDVEGAAPDGAAPGVNDQPGGFEIRRDQPQLLPFWVRHQRLAALLDVPLTDPVFDFLVANRLLLGDNDHASGVAPDLSWNPAKMSLWAKAMMPVCAHPNVKARHPFLNIDLPRAAWGRDPTADEAEGIRADLDAVGLTGAAREQATCIAIVSSLEMVTQ